MYLLSQPVSQLCLRSSVVGTRGVGSRSPMVGTTQARPCTGTTGGWCPQATSMSFCQKESLGETSRLLAVVGARTLALTVGSPRQSCSLESQRKLNSFHSNSLKPVAIFLYPRRSINKSSTKYFPHDNNNWALSLTLSVRGKLSFPWDFTWDAVFFDDFWNYWWEIMYFIFKRGR